ncbi:hypothetical protein BC943DRAFT_357619 [Umbelopsis sp. AD052]|nr:hypothetical protein BC943DRAFT_357619 [Umbelopsis sp. AD052]
MSVQSLYQKATRAYLLTQHVSASHSCIKAINLLNTSESPNHSSLRRMIHVLFVNIATSLAESKDLSTTFRILGLQGKTKEDLMNAVWNKVLEGYAGQVGNVDGSVIAVCLLMSLRLGTARIGQQIAEEWLANVPDTLIAELDMAGPMTESAILSSEDEESPISAYYEVLELYSVSILTTLQDYTSAREFIKYNPYISDQQKKTFDQRIEQKENEKFEEKRRKQEEERKAQESAAAAKAAEEEKKQRQEAMKQKQEPREVKPKSPLPTSPTPSHTKDIPNGNHVEVSKATAAPTSKKMVTMSNQWIEKWDYWDLRELG